NKMPNSDEEADLGPDPDAEGQPLRLPKKAAKVRNKAPASVQITAEQLIREAKERDLEVQAPVNMKIFFFFFKGTGSLLHELDREISFLFWLIYLVATPVRHSY